MKEGREGEWPLLSLTGHSKDLAFALSKVGKQMGCEPESATIRTALVPALNRLKESKNRSRETC